MAASGSTTTAAAHVLERALVTAVGGLAATLVGACGLVLWARRIAGGFDPVGGAGALVAALTGGMLVIACDVAMRAASVPSGWRWLARGGYVLSMAALAIPPRPGSPLDMAMFTAAALVIVGLVAMPLLQGGLGDRIARLRLGPGVARTMLASPPDASPNRSEPDAAQVGHLLQRFERYEFDGYDCLRGTLTLTVAQGARSAHGHVGFCPAFRQLPDVEVGTAYDGVEAVVTAAEVVPWGVRIECRLDGPAEEHIEIPVDVVARAPV